METLSSVKLVIGTKKVGDNYIKKSNCEIIVVVPPMARVRKILSGPLPTLVIPGLSVVILLTRFTSSRGLEEILRFITILPQVQYLPRRTFPSMGPHPGSHWPAAVVTYKDTHVPSLVGTVSWEEEFMSLGVCVHWYFRGQSAHLFRAEAEVTERLKLLGTKQLSVEESP